jgi:ribonucleoside-diphosphate reductase alpha chain
MGRHKKALNDIDLTNVQVNTQNNVQLIDEEQQSNFDKNLPKYIDMASWIIWYPDLFLDLITPPEGGIRLCSDQRTFLRCALRFFSVYGVFPRGWGKTHGEVLAMFIVAIRYPNVELAITAQTKENAAELLKDKTTEILRQYPMLENELSCKPKFRQGYGEVNFKNGAVIDILANSQSSKGQRRKRISIEESALLDNVTFEDALKPIVEVARYTCGKLAIVNPEELNQQINFFTTSGFRGSDEYTRSLSMVKDMINLSGDFVLGSSWQLGCWYGRGSSKSQILQKKKNMSPIAFKMNYESSWVGSSSNALININKFLNCRNLTTPLLEAQSKDDEYYMGVDVARSQNTNNNQSSVAIGKVNRNPNTGHMISVDIVNLVNISNALNFTAQACIIKKLKKLYNAQMVILDGNGLGCGLVDECLKESYDPITKEPLGCWNTVNTDNAPESSKAEKCLFDLKAQGIQTKIITTFIDMVDGGKLRLLEKKQESDFANVDQDNLISKVVPFLQTDLLFEEVSNLKIKNLPSGGLAIEKVVGKIDKDRFSCLSYLLWYVMEKEKEITDKQPVNMSDYFISSGISHSTASSGVQNQFSNLFKH